VEESYTFSRLKNTFENLQEMLRSNVTSVSNKTMNAEGSMSVSSTSGLTCDRHEYLALEIRYMCTDAQILL